MTVSESALSDGHGGRQAGGRPDGRARGQQAPAKPEAAERTVWIAALLDALVIVVFVTIGRSSHEEGVTLTGVAGTAWPFLVGAIVGWLVARVWQRPTSLVPAALAVWSGALVPGMALRAVSGQGTAPSFMIVACCFLAATLFGWRLVAGAVRHRRSRQPSAEPRRS